MTSILGKARAKLVELDSDDEDDLRDALFRFLMEQNEIESPLDAHEVAIFVVKELNDRS